MFGPQVCARLLGANLGGGISSLLLRVFPVHEEFYVPPLMAGTIEISDPADMGLASPPV